MNIKSPPPKTLVRLCLSMEVMLLVSMGTQPFVCGYLLFFPYGGEYPPFIEIVPWTVRENILFVIDNLVIFLVLLQMWFFFNGVRKGELFTLKRVRNTRNIGLILVLGYFLSLIYRTFTDSPYVELSRDYLSALSTELYSLQQLLLGAGLISLSYIFEEGKELKDEQELVI